MKRENPPWCHAVPVEDAATEIDAARLDVAPVETYRLAMMLSPDESDRAGRHAYERDWRRFVVARGRLRELLAARLETCPETIEFSYGKHGKPMLAPPFSRSGLHFNVAHSGDLAVYAFSHEGEVGVDVEALRALPDADDIAARFFSTVEHNAYRGLDTCHKRIGFFNCWTRKEAFLKALGDGLHHPLDAFDVSLAPGEPAQLLRLAGDSGEHCGWRLASFIPAPGYVGALAIRTARPARAAAITAPWSAQALP
ncbi:MAG: 4'-phosphopantetheinyl transferase family protein [Betaproteobacteria bacterium]